MTSLAKLQKISKTITDRIKSVCTTKINKNPDYKKKGMITVRDMCE